MLKSGALAVLGICAMVGSAQAAFTFTTTVEDGQPDAQHTRFELFALNIGNGTGTKALADDITVQAFTPAGQPDTVLTPAHVGTQPDFSGKSIADPYHSAFTFVNLLGDPSGGTSGTDNDPTAFSVVSVDTSPTRQFGPPFSRIEVTGANLSGGVDATAAANGGKGALLAVAVVPSGDDVQFSGNIGGDVGNVFPLPPPIPEPSLLAVMALAPALARRRRGTGR